MITISEFMSFVKTNKEAGVWLERGSFTLYSDGSNGRSQSVSMSSSMFSFLYSLKIIQANNYMGFKFVRTFPIDQSLVKQVKIEALEAAFEKYQKSLKKELKKDKELIVSLMGIKLVGTLKSVQAKLAEKNIPYTLYSATYQKYGGQRPSKLIVGGQAFTYFKWAQDYKRVAEFIPKRLEVINSLISSEQVNELVSAEDFKLAPLPAGIANKLFNTFGYAR